MISLGAIWECRISRSSSFFLDLHLYYWKGDKVWVITVENGSQIVKEVAEGDLVAPTLKLPESALPAILKGLAEFGVKVPDESFRAGKLEATENHLRDLRHLLKLPSVEGEKK